MLESMRTLGDYELKLIAQIGSGFDSWNTLNNVPTRFRLINPNKTANALKTVVLNGLCDVNKNYEGNLQYFFSPCSINQ